MFGVLKIILRRHKVAAPGFGAGQFQVAFVALLRILGLPRQMNLGGSVFA
jgi:hypothetical protein